MGKKEEFLKDFKKIHFDAGAIYESNFSDNDPDWKEKFYKEMTKEDTE